VCRRWRTARRNIAGVTGLTAERHRSHPPRGFDHERPAEDPKIGNGVRYPINNPSRK
jgi:hypothetical protein